MKIISNLQKQFSFGNNPSCIHCLDREKQASSIIGFDRIRATGRTQGPGLSLQKLGDLWARSGTPAPDSPANAYCRVCLDERRRCLSGPGRELPCVRFARMHLPRMPACLRGLRPNSPVALISMPVAVGHRTTGAAKAVDFFFSCGGGKYKGQLPPAARDGRGNAQWDAGSVGVRCEGGTPSS